MPIQRVNATCVLGTVPVSAGVEGLFRCFTHENDY